MGLELAKDYAVLRKSVFDQICNYLKIKLPSENWAFLKTRASELIKDKDKDRKGQVLFVIEVALEINKRLESPDSEQSKYIPTLTGAVLYICNELQTAHDKSTSYLYAINSDLFKCLRTSINMDLEFRKQLSDRQFEELYNNLSSFLLKRTFKTIDNKIHPENGFIVPAVFVVEQFSVPTALVILARNISKHRVTSLEASIKQWNAGPMSGTYDPSMFARTSPTTAGGSSAASTPENHIHN